MQTKIHWLEWNKESFDKAKKEKKPVLLSLSAVWCHWCHRMDEDCYNEDVIADTINTHYVPIRVDIDERPDIRERYNFGGFPSTVFLNSEGLIMGGGTYIPPEHFINLLEVVSANYKKGEYKVQELAEQSVKEEGEFTKEMLPEVVEEITWMSDPEYGGFGNSQKFPFPNSLNLLLFEFLRMKNEDLKNIVVKALDGMIGIFDAVEGGFFRYSVTPTWDEPHYEKMLEANAQLVITYLLAGQVLHEEKYKEVARKVLKYLQNNLLGEWFYGSQDAGEAYYKSDRKRDKPFIDKRLYVNWNCLSVSSFLKASALLDDESLRKKGLEVLDFILKNCYVKGKGVAHLFTKKADVFGELDDQVWFLHALLDAYESTLEERYLRTAEEVVEFCRKELRKSSAFTDRVVGKDDVGALKAAVVMLPGNAAMADALLRLYNLTHKMEYLETGKSVLNTFVKSFQGYSMHAEWYGLALFRYFHGSTITAIGDDSGQDTLKKFSKMVLPKTVEFLHFEKDKERIQKKGYMPSKELTFFVCKGTMCSPPLKDVEKVLKFAGYSAV